MIEYALQLWDFHIWAIVALVAAAVAIVSIVADRRRQRRSKLEQVGFMPWTGISVGAMMVALVSLALAIKAG